MGKKIGLLSVRVTPELEAQFVLCAKIQNVSPARLARRIFAAEIKRVADETILRQQLMHCIVNGVNVVDGDD